MTVRELKQALEFAEDHMPVRIFVNGEYLTVLEVKVEFTPKRVCALEVGEGNPD